MRFFNEQHQHYCGIDLHARTMYVCVLGRDGEVLLHRNCKASPEDFLTATEPYRDDLVVAVECMFAWYWLADLCEQEGIPFVLGHALYMRAIHGGKSKNDKIDSLKIATLLRGGLLPMSYVYPRKMRSTRDVLRRRMFLVRKRAELLAHITNTTHQYNLPLHEKRLFFRRNREDAADRYQDPSARKSVEVDLALINSYDMVLADLDLFIVRTAKEHDPQSYHLLRSVPGIGQVLALVILYEIHEIKRFLRVQDFVSYARLVRCAKESAGKRSGFSNKKIGNAHLKWAFSEAACLFLRNNEKGKKYVARLAGKHGKGKAMSILAHKLGRAVYFMLKRKEAFNQELFLAHA